MDSQQDGYKISCVKGENKLQIKKQVTDFIIKTDRF